MYSVYTEIIKVKTNTSEHETRNEKKNQLFRPNAIERLDNGEGQAIFLYNYQPITTLKICKNELVS